LNAIALDLGGSHAVCAVVSREKVIAAKRFDLEGKAGLARWLPAFAESARQLAQGARMSLGDFAGCAVSICASVDPSTKKVTHTFGKYDDATTLDLADWSRTALGLPLAIENDSCMALLGERAAGAARGCDNLVMFTLGTGIGGAAMVGGQLLRGRHAQAGNLLGHTMVNYRGRPCICGAIGCMEAEASTWSLPAIVREIAAGRESLLQAATAPNFCAVFDLAREGDAVAREVRDHCVGIWAAGALTNIHAFDPELVVFGGGVMRSGDEILPAIQAYIDRHAFARRWRVEVRAAELGDHAALLGAVPLLEMANS
jgi:glucokinase